MRMLSLLSLLVACGGRAKLNPKTPYEVLRTPITIQLTDELSTRMEISVPGTGKGPFPTVILVHGRGPSDLDGTLKGRSGTTPLFKILSEDLTSRGFAVVRYNQRHVKGPNKFDLPAYIADQDLKTFKDDLLAVIDAAGRDARVDTTKLLLVGYDEGADVATAAALERPSVLGVALFGASSMLFREQFEGWFYEQTLLYLERFAYQGKLDGRLLSRAIWTAAAEPVVLQSRLLGVSSTRNSEVVKPSPLVDKDRDGILSLDEEVEPAIPVLVKYAFGPLGSYGYLTKDRAFPPLLEQLERYDRPMLVIQGEFDATTPLKNGRALKAKMEELGHFNQTVKELKGHGHSLGFASMQLDDLPRTISGDARDLLADWLTSQVAR